MTGFEQDMPARGGADRADLVRPYIRTGGRTRGPADLGMETLVSVSPTLEDRDLLPDHRMVVTICATARSVAEVAALAHWPLGVARVLLADLARIGVIRVHASQGSGGNRPDLALMSRVLDGLRRL